MVRIMQIFKMENPLFLLCDRGTDYFSKDFTVIFYHYSFSRFCENYNLLRRQRGEWHGCDAFTVVRRFAIIVTETRRKNEKPDNRRHYQAGNHGRLIGRNNGGQRYAPQ